MTSFSAMHGANEDRIIDLPKNIMDMILEALPIRDAVRTSLLSRKWQYCWVTISKLVFDDDFFKSLGISYSNNSSDLEVKDIFNRILLLHIGPITKFSLHNYNGILSVTKNASPWLHFLSRNGIKELTLSWPQGKLGSQLFFCHALTLIHIVQCDLNPPADFEGFPNLTTLELIRVYTNSKFGDIISACHLLERVSIESCYGISNLVVASPNLKYLHVEHVEDLRTICLKSSKNVATLSISLLNGPEHKMEKLVIGNNILEFSAASVQKRVPTGLENLKKIVISYADFNDVGQIACTLIQSSPKLSELEIRGFRYSWYISTAHDLNFMEDFDDHDCCFGQLKTVKFLFLHDFKAEIALIKLLLACSPLLEHMYINAANGFGEKKAFSLCKKLMQLRRASPKAALIYLDDI